MKALVTSWGGNFPVYTLDSRSSSATVSAATHGKPGGVYNTEEGLRAQYDWMTTAHD